MGSFGGMFAGLSATDLGSAAIKGALQEAGIDASEVEEVFMGNVVSASDESPEEIDREAGANVLDLSDRFDTSIWPTPHSDIVALMVL